MGGSKLLQTKSGWNMNVKLRRTSPKQFVGSPEWMVETLADFVLRARASVTSNRVSCGECQKAWQGCKMDQEKKPLPN